MSVPLLITHRGMVSGNNVLGTLLTKLVKENKTNWMNIYQQIFFSYKTTYKVATEYTPYNLFMGYIL
jgi:hypothetical protein